MEFLPIRVSTLRGDRKIPFDAYIYIAGKYILYCRRGDSFEGTRLNRLKEKKLKKLFIADGEENLYRSYLMENIDRAYDSTVDMPIDLRAEIIQGAQQAAVEDLMESPDLVELYETVQNSAARYVHLILNERQSIKAMLQIENTDNNIAHHGINVSTLALTMASNLGYNEVDTKKLELLTIGCLLHDIGHLDTGLDVGQPISNFSEGEMFIYKDHPTAGANRVNMYNHFDPTVVQIIQEHEEQSGGDGFPNHLKEKDINPLALICATANVYDRMTSFEGMQFEEARKRLPIDKMGQYPLSHLKALTTALKDNKL